MKKSVRPRMKVRCPWCGQSDVTVTRGGLAYHLDEFSASCTGTGRLVALDALGHAVKAGSR